MQDTLGNAKLEVRRTAASAPDFREEMALWEQGFRCIAGVDEVGRGPLAGPVVAAVVVLFPPMLDSPWLRQVRDSKLLSAAQRQRLAPLIQAQARGVGVGVVSHENIDRDGIVQATRQAMAEALQQLPLKPDFVLIDGRERLRIRVKQRAIVKGDRLVTSIAAASIVAKVHRDRLMEALDERYPGWGFAQHKGYGTPQHLEALHRLGPSAIHRRSFMPVSTLVATVADINDS